MTVFSHKDEINNLAQPLGFDIDAVLIKQIFINYKNFFATVIHGCLGLEIPGLDSELVFFCHLCWSCTELVFGICDFLSIGTELVFGIWDF